ncbi:hypothetical protein Sjap_009836 [Stephania japonica]|uniref:Rhodanese domain-containing protein n=1 Tax=Stephania japonica TaxID=461633 RepID=A0AAP0J8H0_9MAGN
MTTMSLPCSSPTSSLPLLLSRPMRNNSNRLPTPPISIQCRLVRDREQSFRSNLIRLKRLAAGRSAEKVGVPTSVPVRVAHDLLLAGHRYLDVRTPEEFSAGHAVGAVNVPYMLKVVDGMAKNPTFLDEVSKHFGKDAEIIVGCKSGKRSLMAATDLSAAGYTGITDIAGGFTAWTTNGLPTE